MFIGYGDQIDKDNCYQPLVDHIDKQYEKYLQEELKITRNIPNYHDTRIHVCLYFLSPTGHSIKSLDLVTMKSLDRKVHRLDWVYRWSLPGQQYLNWNLCHKWLTESTRFQVYVMSHLWHKWL